MLVFLSVPMITGSLLLLLVVVYAGVCAFYYFAQEKLIFVRFRTKRSYKYKTKLEHEELFISSEFDGAELHGLHFKLAESKGLVIYFHGNTGTLKRWAANARYFVANGYEVLMPDPRGYGKSKGKLSEEALIEDARQWYAFACTLCAEERVVVYGRSLGSALASPVCMNTKPKCLVLETPFADLFDVAKHFSILLPYRWLLKYPFRNNEALQQVTSPIYIFHGTRDLVVPYKSALRLYGSIPASVHREMITIEKGRHNDLAKFEGYHSKMAEILS